MLSAPIPEKEEERLVALHSLGILNTGTEKRFDDITKKACEKLKMPISAVTLIDKDREWHKSCQGLDEHESNRGVSFCGHAMMATEMFVIEDTLLDDRFKDNPHVTQKPHIRFYAGVALHENKTHLPVGVFCVKDVKPRQLTTEELGHLMEFAKKAEVELNKKV